MGPQTAAEKKQEIAEQAALFTRAAESGDQNLVTHAKHLKTNYHARDMAALADDVYDAADGNKAKDQPPVGYIRASANPEALRAAGVDWSNDQIKDRLQPSDSGFRAEIYLPDPAILGPDAKPVLVFKGTDSDKNEDWLNNARQGAGMQSDYYDRAMNLGLALNIIKGKEGFEIAGHSLGGGLASAASAVTGAHATTFNSAGLHSDTAPRFLEGRQLFDTDNTVNAYQVKGEVLTSVQNGVANMTDFRRAQLGFLAETASDLSQTPGLKEPVTKLIQAYVITPDKDASPEEKQAIQGRAQTLTQDAKELIDHLASTDGKALLKRMPTAAGELMPMLEAKMLDKNGQFVDKPMALPLGDLGELAAPIANALTITTAAAKGGQQVGVPIRAGGEMVERGLDRVGDAQQTTLSRSGNVAKQVIEQGGDEGGKFVRTISKGAATTRQGIGEVEAEIHQAQGKAQGAFFDVSAGFFHKVGLDGLAERSERLGKEARSENKQEAAQALANANVDARQIRYAGDGVAKGMENSSTALGSYVQQQHAETGRYANAITDNTGHAIRNATNYAPAAGAVAGAALSSPLANTVLHNPLEEHKNQLAALFLMKAVGQATDRHLMETIRPSLDFKIEQEERTLLKSPLMQKNNQQHGDPKQVDGSVGTLNQNPTQQHGPSMVGGKAKLGPDDLNADDKDQHEKIRIGLQKLGLEGVAGTNVTAALLLAAKEHGGITRIDEIRFNEAGTKHAEGALAMVAYRPHGEDKPPFFNTRVDVAEASKIPAEKTFQQIENFNQQQSQQQALAQQQAQEKQQNQQNQGSSPQLPGGPARPSGPSIA